MSGTDCTWMGNGWIVTGLGLASLNDMENGVFDTIIAFFFREYCYWLMERMLCQHSNVQWWICNRITAQRHGEHLWYSKASSFVLVNAVVGPWGEWFDCTQTCNGGNRNRTRPCEEQQHGGTPCSVYVLNEQEPCGTDACHGMHKRTWLLDEKKNRAAWCEWMQSSFS